MFDTEAVQMDEQRRRASGLLLLDGSISDMRPRQGPLAPELDDIRHRRIGSSRRNSAVAMRETEQCRHTLDDARSASRASVYGTEGHRFESSRARYLTRKIVRICRSFASVRAI
jgi:hypothetical protein